MVPTILKPLDRADFEGLYKIVVEEEPFGNAITFEHFKLKMYNRDGWTFWKRDALIGALTLFDFEPFLNMSVHAVVDKRYKRRWVNRAMLKQMFSYAFKDLELRRLSSFWILGLTDDAGKLLYDLGFEIEGITRRGFRDPNGNFHDVANFGMLSEECKWM
ncbi:MAG: GNAT family protein [Dehalococcoidia bacterium]|jgi:RimJ/RimL family protein N-acetyltransferase